MSVGHYVPNARSRISVRFCPWERASRFFCEGSWCEDPLYSTRAGYLGSEDPLHFTRIVASWEPLGGLLGLPGGRLGSSWGLLVASWGSLEASGEPLGAEGSKCPFGSPVWAPSWSRLGGLFGHLGGLLGCLGALLGSFGALLEASWAVS